MLEIVIWDVQHGSAAYIKTPKEKHIVIDLGVGSYSEENQETFSPLLHLKENYNIDTLDNVTITHPHTDHIDDILNYDELSPKVLTRPKHLSEEDIRKANPNVDTEKIDKYLEINERYCFPVSESENPKLPENNGGVSFKVFTPTKCSTSNINNHSIVTIIDYLGVKILIPGDNESASWKELLEKDNFVKAIKGVNIFVSSHHGRESGYYSELFEHFKPYLTIVSDGAETDTSAVDRYSKVSTGWKVYKRSGGSEERCCLTTRNDGYVTIKIGKGLDEKVFLNVKIK